MANGNGGDPRDAAHEDEKRTDVQAPIPSTIAEPTLAVDLQMAEIDRLVATAHKYPRNLKAFKEQLDWMACHNEAAAENCVYALPRAGKAIVGASIGFANLAATCWGNIWDMGRWVYTDRKEKVVIAEGVCIDWQTNRRVAMTEQRRIVTSKGLLFTDDMIIVTSKAASSIARRNVILQIIPRPLWYPTYEKALYMVKGSEQTLVARREAAVKALANFGVDPKRVFMYLGVSKLEEVGVEHMPTLRGMFAQLRDGAVTVEEMFDPRKMTGAAFDTVVNPLAEEDEPVDPKIAPAETTATDAGKPAAVTTAAAEKPASEPADAPGAEQGAAPASEPVKAAASQEGGKKEKVPAKAKAAADKPATVKPAEPPPAPRTSEDYLAYATGPQGWVTLATKATTTAAALDDRRKAERKMRETCGVMEDELLAFQGAFQAKMAELKA